MENEKLTSQEKLILHLLSALEIVSPDLATEENISELVNQIQRLYIKNGWSGSL